jgi:hypothetical protein
MSKQTIMMLPDFLESATLLQKDIKSKLIKSLFLLSQDFRHPSLQCKKVQGAHASVYECRVDQGIRLIYDMMNGTLRCWYVGEHDKALKLAARSEAPISSVHVEDIEVVTTNLPLDSLKVFMMAGIIPPNVISIELDEFAAKLTE